MHVETFAYTDLPKTLAQEIHQHRTSQFVNRLGWDLTVEDDGGETDQFDDEHAQYVVVRDKGQHALSCRIRPAAVGTMIEECFSDVFPLARSFLDYQRGSLWEVTRFCRSPGISTIESAQALRTMSFELDDFRDRNAANGFVAVVYPHFPRFLQRLGSRHLRLSEGVIDGQQTQLICVTQSVDFRGTKQGAGRVSPNTKRNGHSAFARAA